jgi:outer membrane scaffolding protein for murein synthesis (MipA/OmpV family)
VAGWVRVPGWVHASCFVALYCGRALAQEQQGTPEVDVSTERQNALENESITLTATPDVGPHLNHTTAVVALGAFVHPVYPGSKRSAVDVFPYVDIRGLLNDRVFVSDANGILGVKLLNDGLVRAGVGLNIGNGRTSSDDPRLKGLPNVKPGGRVQGYIALALRPVSLEAGVETRVGQKPGTLARFSASYNIAPLPQLHVSVSASIAHANAAYQNLFFGITPADAAAAGAQGNPLPAYSPRSGLTSAAFITTVVYQFNKHWGVLAFATLDDVIGPSRDSPLTQRTTTSVFAIGAVYSF